MCDYIKRKDLIKPRDTLLSWINNAHNYMRKNYKITFQHFEIGSASRNMVVKKCNSNFFDLDYEFEIISWPSDYDINDARDLKLKFKKALDETKPHEFKACEDSTQALTSENNEYGVDIIITIRSGGNYFILRNNKNRNNANNKDYQWAQKNDCSKLRVNLAKIKGLEMWNDLRDKYLGKKHDNRNITDKNDPRFKHSYQLLNEAVNEVL